MFFRRTHDRAAPRRASRGTRAAFMPSLEALEVRLAPSATYYVRPSGNDANDGLSERFAWQTLDRVNRYGPRAGDTILLEADQTFSGTLEIWRGDPNNPITVSSYGGGRATIASGGATGLIAGTPGGLHVRNLRLTGSGAENNFANGLELANDGVRHARNLTLENVEVTGYGAWGIYVWSDSYGLSDLTVHRVQTHHNGNGGYIGSAGRRITNVLLSEVRAYENDRLAPTSVSGFGVQVEGVNQLVVERSVFANNGSLGGASAGDTGLYVLNATNVRVEHNEAYGNWDGYWGDGSGMAFGHLEDSVVQYNYSHDNGGPGIVLALDHDGTTTSRRNTIRYNVLQNNVAGMQFTGNVYDTEFYNNTIFSEHGDTGFRANVIFSGWTGANANLRNNIFLTAQHSAQILVDDASMPGSGSIVFQGNAYYNLTKPATTYIILGSQGYYTLDEFRARTGQEMLFGVLPVGFQLDPELVNPGGGRAVGNPDALASLSAYRLRDVSPLAGAGLDLRGRFGIDPGRRDYYGNSLPAGPGLSVGAHQPPVGESGGGLTPAQGFVTRAYRGLLGRAADPAGQAAWAGLLEAGGTRDQVARGLVGSAEYHETVASELYRGYLRREADSGGLSAFAGFLAGGGTVEAAAATVLGSREYFDGPGGGTNAGFVAALYRDVLGRAADPAGLAAFGAALAAGTSRGAVAAVVLASEEYARRLVGTLYANLLGRAADAAGLAAFVGFLRQGGRREAVIVALVASAEFFGRP